jgi:hypothetical protein
VTWSETEHPRWPRGSKPPPPGKVGGRFMPKGAAWADAASGQIARRSSGGRRSVRGASVLPSTPDTDLGRDEQARVRRLVRRDPMVFATARDRFGGFTTDNLGREDEAWLQSVYKRDRVFVERAAQDTEIQRMIRRRAKEAGQTPSTYRASVAAELRGLLVDKPIAVRVRDEAALQDIIAGGRFKTSHEGVKRASGLLANMANRRLGEHILGVPADTPPERRPIYGYVAINGIEPALSGGRQIPGVREREDQEDLLSSYGQIQVVLKPDVRPRTTITVGDSLDEIAFMRPTPVDSPTAESLGIHRLNGIAEPGFTRTSYVEAQVHGGIRVDDIAEVVFPQPPAAATAGALDRRGIPWRVLSARTEVGR